MWLTSARLVSLGGTEFNLSCWNPQLGADVTRAEHRLPLLLSPGQLLQK